MNTVIPKRQARIFKSAFLEFFTKSSLGESILTSIAISGVCIWVGYLMGGAGVVAYFLGGLASWTFFEYLIHRFLFHISETAFKGSKRLQFVLHGVHHDSPNDPQRILMPTLPKILLALPFFALFYLLLGAEGSFFSAGFMAGYFIYSMMHYAMHKIRSPRILKGLWRHHHLHHRYPHKGFGLSSTLWDRVFGTMP